MLTEPYCVRRLVKEFEVKDVQGRKMWRFLCTDIYELQQEISVVPEDKKTM